MKGFEGRRLGPVQMTTDTAVRVTRLVVQGKSGCIPCHGSAPIMIDNAIAPVNEIPYLDHPELKFNEHESTEMPFRYVKGEDGQPIMPDVRTAPSSVHSPRSPDGTGHGGVDRKGHRQGNRRHVLMTRPGRWNAHGRVLTAKPSCNSELQGEMLNPSVLILCAYQFPPYPAAAPCTPLPRYVIVSYQPPMYRGEIA